MGLGRRQTTTEGAIGGPLQAKIEEAWRDYRATCLWNLRKPSSTGDISSIVRALRTNGNMNAWHLATEIEGLMPRTHRGAR